MDIERTENPLVNVKINKTVSNLESSLNSCVNYFKELKTEVDDLYQASQVCKLECLTQNNKCNSQSCPSSEALLQTINYKDKILESVKSILKKFDDTKDIKVLSDLFKLFSLEMSVDTPCQQKEVKDESLSEIENTPTGRMSPIIFSRTMKNSLLNIHDIREKKKCIDTWTTPPKKAAKMTNSTPNRKSNGRYVQSRLNVQTLALKPNCTVDLTCSPEFTCGLRSKKADSASDIKPIHSPIKKKCLKLKRESDENGEKQMVTIKQENFTNENENLSDLMVENVINDEDKYVTDIENSINLMNNLHHRFKHPAGIKIEKNSDRTTCTQNESMSLLNQPDLKPPAKEPLSENMNIMNCELESSMSLLRKLVTNKPDTCGPVKIESTKDIIIVKEDIALYKEPTVRKKAEKRALPGWNCDECKNFYDELYKNDPEMLEKLMQECSKHRGRHNPARPKTPEGFWNPRWDVPQDTDEFNLRNNAA